MLSIANRALRIVEDLEANDQISYLMLDSSPCNFGVEPITHYHSYGSNISRLPICDVYCDGASRGNGSYEAIAGYGIYFENNNLPYSAAVPFDSSMLDRPTNQVVELLAIKDALYCIWKYYTKCEARFDEPEFQFEIVTDSMYSINCLTEWCNKWKLNGWTNCRGYTVMNSDIIQKCVEYREKIEDYMGFPITFTHVKGHSGNIGNTVADLLANKACDMV